MAAFDVLRRKDYRAIVLNKSYGCYSVLFYCFKKPYPIIYVPSRILIKLPFQISYQPLNRRITSHFIIFNSLPSILLVHMHMFSDGTHQCYLLNNIIILTPYGIVKILFRPRECAKHYATRLDIVKKAKYSRIVSRFVVKLNAHVSKICYNTTHHHTPVASHRSRMLTPTSRRTPWHTFLRSRASPRCEERTHIVHHTRRDFSNFVLGDRQYCICETDGGPRKSTWMTWRDPHKRLKGMIWLVWFRSTSWW